MLGRTLQNVYNRAGLAGRTLLGRTLRVLGWLGWVRWMAGLAELAAMLGLTWLPLGRLDALAG